MILVRLSVFICLHFGIVADVRIKQGSRLGFNDKKWNQLTRRTGPSF